MSVDAHLLRLLHEHITCGSLKGTDVARIDDLHLLARPEHFTDVNEMWRVVVLDDAQHQRLMAGEEITLEDRPYESWAPTRSALYEFQRSKMAYGKEGHQVVMRREFNPPLRVIDVHRMAIALDYPKYHNVSWIQYGELEREIIVPNAAAVSRVSPEDVIEHEVDRGELFKPKIGECFFHSPGCENVQIAEDPIGFHQEYQAYVIPHEGHYFYVSWEQGLICFHEPVQEPEMDTIFDDHEELEPA